jgi:double-stranded uracil-DNA glycosylase
VPITERLTQGMNILFIGYNPSLTSHAKGLNYAGKINRLYHVLYQSGLTTRLYRPEESPMLLDDYGYGFTNIVARPTKTAAEIRKEEYAEGRMVLLDKLTRYRPKFACYVGKGVYEQFARPKNKVPWGFQSKDIVDGVRDFVAPSTSGLVRMKLSVQVAIYRMLAEAVKTSRPN